MSTIHQRVLVIALDGATLDLILPWAEQGLLPNMKRLIDGGVTGALASTYPPLTGPAWSSFMTGKTPAEHGVLEFFRRQEGTYNQVLNTRYDIDGKSLWRRLSEGGLQVGVMGVPLTYPPEPVNGFIITGLLTPHGRRDFTHPPELLDELENELGNFLMRHDEKYHPTNPQPFLDEEDTVLENNTRAALYLMTHKPWDFLMLHFLGTDRIQHEMWHVMDTSHPQHDPQERQRLGNVVLAFYQKIDASIGKLIEVANGANIIIMSDHGFGPVHKFINFNNWLLEKGYMKLKKSPATWARHMLLKLGFNYQMVTNWILRLGLGKFAIQAGRAKRENIQRRLFLSLEDVDWSKTKVYSIGNFGQLYVNLQGREPQGSVAPGEEYAALVQALINDLQKLTDPENGLPVIEEIYRREQIYQGPYAEKAPDVVFLTRGMLYKAMGLSDFSSPRVFDPVYGTSGHHRMDGVLLCYGPGVFEQGKKVKQARIQDLAPTILYLLNQPVPYQLSGKVLFDIFTPEFQDKTQVRYFEETTSDDTISRNKLSPQEEAELMERLRSLGYVN